MPPIAIAGAAVAGGAIIGGAIEGQQQADAYGNAANAQLAQARATQTTALSMAQPSVSQLMAQQQQLQATEQGIARNEQLLSAVDPALIESGKQALQLLQGKQAAILQPLQQERDRQRTQLVNSLNEQMGPGGANSTAGQEALNRFDQETAQTMAGAQQNAIGQLLQTSLAARPNSFQGAQALNGYNELQQNQQRMSIGALLNTNLTPYAGAPFAGDYASSGAWKGTFGQLANLGGAVAGGAMAGGGGGGSANLTPTETAQLGNNISTLRNMNQQTMGQMPSGDQP